MAFEDRQNRMQRPIVQGGDVVFRLGRGLKVLQGRVILAATVVISGVTAAGTAIGEGGPINLIRRIKVLANKAAGSRYPNGALVDCHPQTLTRFAMTQRSGKFVGELSGSSLGNGANGTYNIYLSIPIYFADDTNQNGVQTALNMDAKDSQGNKIYSAVQVRVEFADLITELWSGNNGTMVVTGMCKWQDDRLAIQSDTTPLIQEDHDVPIYSANPRLVDDAMPNDGSFSTWLILAQQGEPEFALSDAILQRLEMQGATINFRETWQDIRQEMIDDGFFDPSQTLTGQFFLDWTHGVLANSNDAASLSHELAVLNPSGSGNDQLRVYTRRAFSLA